MPPFVPYRTDAEIVEVVRKFESCEYQKDEFPHFRHLTVAAWYLTQISPEDSLLRLRESLLRFTRHHQVTAYHETMTQFWLRLTREVLRQSPPDMLLNERVNALVEQLGRKEIVFDYYSRERIMSEEARSRWLPPDLRDLDSSTPSVP